MSAKVPYTQQDTLQALLREIRHRAGLRQINLANQLGVAQSFISKYEGGERRLDILELKAVCEACGTTLTEFAIELEQRIG
jgi:transcriptional regulator with XRE-family HTH domain